MQVKIFGCKVNKYYTDKWINSDYLKDKQGIFIASCVVTDSAKRKWIKFVKESSKEIQKDEKIYISGCGAFKDGRAQQEFFELYPELVGLREYIEVLGEDPDAHIFQNKKPANTIDISKLGALTSKLKDSGMYTKKFVLIQGGCDSFCTFCLTVIKRGRHFYRSKEEIAEEIQEFADNGGKEAVLTGVNLSAWGLKNTYDPKNFSPEITTKGIAGQGSRFAELLKYILEHTSIPRLRISSLGPEFIDTACLEVFKNTRVYPHFHFSAQSGSSEVLADMKRHYNGDYIKDIMLRTKNLIREDGVDISLGADIIIGFPGETEQNFRQTYDFIREVGIQKLHAFPFSPHEMGESVPAGKFEDQISDKEKKVRMQAITELGDQIRANFTRSQKGKTLQVLIEQVQGDCFKGWTQNYIEATEKNFQITSGSVKRNSIVEGVLINEKV